METRGRRTKSVIRNQVQIAVSGSLLPLWEKARMRVRRALARLCGRDVRAPRGKPTLVSPSRERARVRARAAAVDKSATRNQPQIPTSGSLLPSWEKARMRVRRAQARLRGRDARAPSSPPSFPVIIPTKAGIQKPTKPAIPNQAQIPTSGSPLPSRAYRDRFGFSSFRRTQEPGGRGERRAKSAIRNQARTASSGSLLPLWEKARMRVRRAQARLCGRDARAPARSSPRHSRESGNPQGGEQPIRPKPSVGRNRPLATSH